MTRSDPAQPRASIAIELDHVSKTYTLGTFGHGTLYRDLQTWWARMRGRPDPNAKIFASSTPTPTGAAQRKFDALKDVSLRIKSGDVVGIIGRNGAGKSTLLKLLSRITAPSSGEIRMRGRVASLLEVGTGFHSELTGRENVYLNGAILGMTRAEVDRKFDEIVEFSELRTFIDTPVKRYSSGMIVRLAFAVAAHLDAEVLIVDEVLAVGDAAFRKKCLGKMQGLAREEARTILFVSHDMGAIQNICTSGVVLSQGRVVFEGTVKEAVQCYIDQHRSPDGGTEWLADRSLPFAEVFAPRSFSIERKRGLFTGVVFGGDGSEVVARGELRTKDPRLQIFVGLYSQDDTLLFASDVRDDPGTDMDSLPTGQVAFSLALPEGLLKSGSYSVELIACLHHVGWILPPGNPTRISFEYVVGASSNPYESDSRLGLLAPRLSWRVG